MDDRRDMQNHRPQQNINLQPKDILEKDFKQKMRGYDQAEVDEFLDDVIKDYETFNSQIQQLSQENARLIARVDELSKQGVVGGGQANMAAGNGGPATNATTSYDVLKRLSNLERRVFGQAQGQTQPRETPQAQATPNRHMPNYNSAAGNPNPNPNPANTTISSRANAAHYQSNNVNVATGTQPQNRNMNGYQNPNNGGMNRPNMPQNNPNANPNGMRPNNIPNSNITDARPNNNRHYQDYGNNRFDQNDPDPRYQNNNNNRYNNDLNRF